MTRAKESEWPPLMLRQRGDRTLDDGYEPPEVYGQRRANETGHPYIVSNIGHVLMDCRTNRTTLRRIKCKVVLKIAPKSET